MSTVQILATIQNLESQLALLRSMVQGSSSPAKTETPKAKKVKEATDEPPKEKKPMSEGVRLWNILIAETLEQMKASDWKHPETGKSATRKDAMAAASASKKSTVPSSPPKAGKASSIATAEESGTESDSKKKGPKKGSHWSPETKAAAAAKRAAKKALPSSPPPEVDSDAEDEMVKTIISGRVYFINSRTNQAYLDGNYEGLFDGTKINAVVV